MKTCKTLFALFMLGCLPLNHSAAKENGMPTSLEKARQEAEAIKPMHLLDGTSVEYYYQNGSGIQLELYDGMLRYEWIAGPRKGNGNKDLPYRSRKIGDRFYVISWLEPSHPDYTTLIFNFNNNVMYSSGIFRFGKPDQFIRFDGGIIQTVHLVEKEK